MQFKYALMNAYGNNRDTLRDLMLFWSSKEDKLTSLQEYVDRMPESQEKIYYVCADSVEHAAKMPQAERVLKAGYEVLYLTVDEDEIVLQMLENAGGKPFVSVADENALPVTEEEKANVEQAEKDHKDVLDFAQETLKDQVAKVRLSKILRAVRSASPPTAPRHPGDGEVLPQDAPGLPHAGSEGAGAQPRLLRLPGPVQRLPGGRQGEGRGLCGDPLQPGPHHRRLPPA